MYVAGLTGGFESRLFTVVRMFYKVGLTFRLPDIDMVVEHFDWYFDWFGCGWVLGGWLVVLHPA